jgi:hypothetical protein
MKERLSSRCFFESNADSNPACVSARERIFKKVAAARHLSRSPFRMIRM